MNSLLDNGKTTIIILATPTKEVGFVYDDIKLLSLPPVQVNVGSDTPASYENVQLNLSPYTFITNEPVSLPVPSACGKECHK